MTYRYGMRLRGFSIGCQPRDGFIERMDDPSGRYYDILAYDRQLAEKELEDYELDDLNERNETMAKYYVVDCISGYHDEEDEPYTSLAEARAERDAMNRQAIKEGHRPDFWLIVDSKGNEVK